MFDSKEIAARALHRADEVKHEKQQRQRRLKNAGVAFGLCLAILTAVSPLVQNSLSKPTTIEDDPIPLSAPGVIEVDSDSKTIPADALEMQIELLDPEIGSEHFTFELVWPDTQQVLYTSDLISPSATVGDIVLQEPLKPGEYALELTVRVYEPDGTTPIGTHSVSLTLIARE